MRVTGERGREAESQRWKGAAAYQRASSTLRQQGGCSWEGRRTGGGRRGPKAGHTLMRCSGARSKGAECGGSAGAGGRWAGLTGVGKAASLMWGWPATWRRMCVSRRVASRTSSSCSGLNRSAVTSMIFTANSWPVARWTQRRTTELTPLPESDNTWVRASCPLVSTQSGASAASHPLRQTPETQLDKVTSWGAHLGLLELHSSLGQRPGHPAKSNIELTGQGDRGPGFQALPLPLEVSPDTEPPNLPHAPETHKEKAGRSDLRSPPDFTHFHGYPI